jgi:periplasmic divalent cation tolerance protein
MRSIEPTDVPPYFWTINTRGPYHDAVRHGRGPRATASSVSEPAIRVVLSTFPSAEKAAEVARILVEEQLCACVNIIPAVRSIYRWQGEVSDDSEALAVIKTTSECFPPLADRLRSLHPYEVPEIIALDVADGHAPYLAWVAQSVR